MDADNANVNEPYESVGGEKNEGEERVRVTKPKERQRSSHNSRLAPTMCKVVVVVVYRKCAGKMSEGDQYTEASPTIYSIC